MTASIILKNIYVNGVDTRARADGIKKWFIRKGNVRGVKIPILQGVSFEAKPGDKIAFIGRNGSGKSSLLKAICGIYPLASGYRKVEGSIAPLIELGIGLDPELSGLKNIKISFAYRGQLKLYSKKLEKEIIEFSELGDKIHLPLKSYSSGMNARLAFSCTVFQDPDILLLDEVLSVGDKGFVKKSSELIKERFKDAPISIIVHHSIEAVQDLCNRFILMEGGKIVAEGQSSEIVKKYEKEIFKDLDMEKSDLLDKYYYLSIFIVAKNTVTRRYQDSFLGFLWTLIAPASQITIYALVMPKIMKFPSELYVPFLISSMLVWMFISYSIIASSTSLISNASMITRCLVSKTIFVIAELAQQFYFFMVALTIGYVFSCVAYGTFHPNIIFLPLYLILILLALIPVMIAISFIAIYIKDVKEFIAIAMNFIFWATPVVYPIEVFSPDKRWIFYFNPFYIMIKPISGLLLKGTIPSYVDTARLLALIVISFLISYPLYRKLRKNYIFYL